MAILSTHKFGTGSRSKCKCKSIPDRNTERNYGLIHVLCNEDKMDRKNHPRFVTQEHIYSYSIQYIYHVYVCICTVYVYIVDRSPNRLLRKLEISWRPCPCQMFLKCRGGTHQNVTEKHLLNYPNKQSWAHATTDATIWYTVVPFHITAKHSMEISFDSEGQAYVK